MATKISNHQYETQLQSIKSFALNMEKLSFLTLIFLPKYYLLCVYSLFLSVFLFNFSRGFLKKQGLRLSEQENYDEAIFCIENVMMALLGFSGYLTNLGVYIWALAICFFAYNNAIYIMKQGNLFHKLYASPSNNPRLNPSQENGYIFWIVRTTVITVGIVPFNCLVNCFHYFALGLVLVPAIGYYIFKPENNPSVSSRDPKKAARSSNSNDWRLKIDKFISLLESHLFWLERVAIYCSIVCSSKRPLIFALTNALYMLLSFPRENVGPYEPDYPFWIERTATIFLVDYGFDESSFSWCIASILFALTNLVYFTNPISDLLEILKLHLDNVRLFDDFEEDSNIEGPLEQKVKIKRLKSKNNVLKNEKALCGRDLNKRIKENEDIKRLMKEKEDHWDEINRRLSSFIRDLNRDKFTLAKKLDKAIELSEERKRVMDEREDIWQKTLDLEKSQHMKQMREKESVWEKTVKRELENSMLTCEESQRAEILKYQKQLFRAEMRVSELTVKLEQASSRANESDVNLLASAWLNNQAVISQLKEDNERVLNKYMRCRDQLTESEAKVAELVNEIEEKDGLRGPLSEENERVEKKCEIYRCLLHDHDCEEVVKGVVG